VNILKVCSESIEALFSNNKRIKAKFTTPEIVALAEAIRNFQQANHNYQSVSHEGNTITTVATSIMKATHNINSDDQPNFL